MRRWQLCLALSFLVSVTALPGAEAAMSARNEAGAIVSGVLTDLADHPMAGALDLFAWPTGRTVEVGQVLHLVPVGSDRAADDGRFSITGNLTPELAELARLNGGYVNFALQAFGATGFQESHLSRYVGDAPITAQEAGRTQRPAEWKASPDERAEPLRIRVEPDPSASTGKDRIHPMQGGCSGQKLVETQIGDTVVGELRTPQDTLESFFAYGERADSEIGVAVRTAGGRWSSEGSYHIANTENTDVKKWAQSNEHQLVTARFIYERYEYECPVGRREKVVAREWMGDLQSRPTAVRGCAGVPEDRVGRYAAGVEFNRAKDRAVEWKGAASVFGVGIEARSGYSKWVKGHWKFGSEPMHLLCGDDGPPKRAGHIYAGTTS